MEIYLETILSPRRVLAMSANNNLPSIKTPFSKHFLEGTLYEFSPRPRRLLG